MSDNKHVITPKIEFKNVTFYILNPHAEKYDILGTIVAEHGEQRIESEDEILSPRNFEDFADLCSSVFPIITGGDVEKLKIELLKLKPEARKVVDETGGAAPSDASKEILEEFEEEEIPEEKLEEAEEIINEGKVLLKILELTDEAWVEDYERKLIYWISSLSRPLLGESLNCCSIGPPGKGKSALQKLMLDLLPNENSFYRTEISAKHIQYITRELGSDCFENTVALYDDASLSEEKVNTLEAIADPEKDEIREGTLEKQKTLILHLAPPPVIWTNLTQHFWKDTLRSRFFEESPNETAEMDEKVAKHQQEDIRMDTDRKEKVDYELGKALFRKSLEKFKNYRAITPYEWRWNANYDRRLQPIFGRLLRIITLLNSGLRYKVKVKGGTVLVFSTFDDFYIAKMLMDKFIEEKQGLTDTKVKILDALEVGKDNAKTAPEIAEETGLNRSTVTNNLRNYSTNLSKLGFVNFEEPEKKGGRSHAYKYWKTGQRKCFKTFLSLSDFYSSSISLKIGFEGVFRNVCSEFYDSNPNVVDVEKFWNGYWENVTNSSTLTYPNLQTFMKKPAETAKSIITGEKTFEPIKQILKRLDKELKPKKEILKNKLHRLYHDEPEITFEKDHFVLVASKKFGCSEDEIKKVLEETDLEFAGNTSEDIENETQTSDEINAMIKKAAIEKPTVEDVRPRVVKILENSKPLRLWQLLKHFEPLEHDAVEALVDKWKRDGHIIETGSRVSLNR